MKILIITRNPWDDSNAVGNTLTNFFSGISETEFANIYFRNSKPNNDVCRLYYQTSETDVLKRWLSPKSIGNKFTYIKEEQEEQNKSSIREQKAIHFVHKNKMRLAYFVSDTIWYSEKWINENLDTFIKDFSPDLIFTFAKSAPQYYLTVRYIHEKYHIPYISWIADDEYTNLLKNNKTKQISNLKYILSNASAVRGCSAEICNYYNSIFNCSAIPLYKQCDFDFQTEKKYEHPSKFVYVGNLLYGRIDTLSKIAAVLSEMKSDKFVPEFHIYSNTMLGTREIQECFGSSDCVKYHGRENYDIIKNKLAEADVVVFAESFEQEQIDKTKYSFSTKIIDYLQCGSAILAVGPSNISSIKYLQSIPGVFCIDNLNEIADRIGDLASNSLDIKERTRLIHEYALKHHGRDAFSKNMNRMLKIAANSKG